ncbi:MAG: DMT family transporter [Mariniphaga sp.]|nr:DMT family transporter [Mariniphaga sp.]
MQNHTRGIIYASITVFFWDFLAIALKVAVNEIEPITIVWFRFLIAFIFLTTWQAFKNPGSFKILIKPPILLIFAALALSWNYLSFMFGVHFTTPSNAQLFIQTGPVTLAIIGFTFFKERLGLRQVFGFMLAISGLVLFYNQQLTALSIPKRFI